MNTDQDLSDAIEIFCKNEEVITKLMFKSEARLLLFISEMQFQLYIKREREEVIMRGESSYHVGAQYFNQNGYVSLIKKSEDKI